mgnify:CR=1 FL=1
MRRLLAIDPMTGVRTFHDYDHLSKVTTITTSTDVQPILEANKTQFNDEGLKRQGIKNGWWKVASIPNALIEKWRFEEGIDCFNKNHRQAVMRKLKSPEYRYLRTSSGGIA